MTLALDPFQRVVRLHWGALPGVLAVFAFDLMGMAANQTSAITTTLVNAQGQTRGSLLRLGDLLPWPDGGMVGLDVSPVDGTMRVVRTADRRLPPGVSLASAPLPLMARARLWPLADGRIGVLGLELGTQCTFYAGPLEDGSPLSFQSVATTVAIDPGTGRMIGELFGVAGTPTLGGRLFLGCHTNALEGADASRVILGVEIVGTSLSRRLVEASPRPASEYGFWSARAVAAWGGRFWVATTRVTSPYTDQRHVLYSFAPGGEPDDGLDIGGVEGGVPWGVMVQAIEPEGVPDPYARWGGMWVGDRLVMGVVPSAFKPVPYTGLLRADGPAGVLVVDGAGAPVFRPTPPGYWLGGAHCLGPETGSPAASWWLCSLIDVAGHARMALTRDFQTWSLDPEGVQAVPAHLYTQSRWGAFRV